MQDVALVPVHQLPGVRAAVIGIRIERVMDAGIWNALVCVNS